MANATSLLSGTITLTDALSKQPVTRDIGSPSLAGAVGRLSTYQNLAIGPADVSLELPAAIVYCVYIKNLHAANKLTVKVTPSGGAAATVTTLEPGGVFIVWNPTAGGGFTNITVNASANNTPFEYYMGA